MRCTSPRTVGFKADGKTITWSQKQYSKEFATFPLPCGKCIECRLEYARSWAIRCVHEAQMHEKNIFLTLTYDDAHLGENLLDYRDFQLFVKKLRDHIGYQPEDRIGYFVTGEYGEKSKRKHWHTILFNYAPDDAVKKYTSYNGDQVYSSDFLQTLWGQGNIEFGSVTLKSAGYCARYAVKKLGHGIDGSHDFNPISKKSSHQAIGKKFLEKFWPDIFNAGQIITSEGDRLPIPRYYLKWLQKNHPAAWMDYVTNLKSERSLLALKKEEKEKNEYMRVWETKRARNALATLQTKNETRKKITKSNIKRLKEGIKL